VIDIPIDPDSGTPPYEQVRTRIADLAAAGQLPAGTKLPPVRKLADDLGLAANTVARAYRELEALGVIETRGRAGSVVTGGGADRAAREAAHAYAETARSLGLDETAAVELVRRAFR
jgi:DNA-binding transcriptional regulator YhcF (GntR family)